MRRLGLILALTLPFLAAAVVAGQSPRAVPRLADGHPDLQGVYDLATLTPVERRAGSPLVLTDEDAKKLEQQVADRYAKADAPIEANRALQDSRFRHTERLAHAS